MMQRKSGLKIFLLVILLIAQFQPLRVQARAATWSWPKYYASKFYDKAVVDEAFAQSEEQQIREQSREPQVREQQARQQQTRSSYTDAKETMYKLSNLFSDMRKSARTFFNSMNAVEEIVLDKPEITADEANYQNEMLKKNKEANKESKDTAKAAVKAAVKAQSQPLKFEWKGMLVPQKHNQKEKLNQQQQQQQLEQNKSVKEQVAHSSNERLLNEELDEVRKQIGEVAGETFALVQIPTAGLTFPLYKQQQKSQTAIAAQQQQKQQQAAAAAALQKEQEEAAALKEQKQQAAAAAAERLQQQQQKQQQKQQQQAEAKALQKQQKAAAEQQKQQQAADAQRLQQQQQRQLKLQQQKNLIVTSNPAPSADWIVKPTPAPSAGIKLRQNMLPGLPGNIALNAAICPTCQPPLVNFCPTCSPAVTTVAAVACPSCTVQLDSDFDYAVTPNPLEQFKNNLQANRLPSRYYKGMPLVNFCPTCSPPVSTIAPVACPTCTVQVESDFYYAVTPNPLGQLKNNLQANRLPIRYYKGMPVYNDWTLSQIPNTGEYDARTYKNQKEYKDMVNEEHRAQRIIDQDFLETVKHRIETQNTPSIRNLMQTDRFQSFWNSLPLRVQEILSDHNRKYKSPDEWNRLAGKNARNENFKRDISFCPYEYHDHHDESIRHNRKYESADERHSFEGNDDGERNDNIKRDISSGPYELHDHYDEPIRHNKRHESPDEWNRLVDKNGRNKNFQREISSGPYEYHGRYNEPRRDNRKYESGDGFEANDDERNENHQRGIRSVPHEYHGRYDEPIRHNKKHESVDKWHSFEANDDERKENHQRDISSGPHEYHGRYDELIRHNKKHESVDEWHNSNGHDDERHGNHQRDIRSVPHKIHGSYEEPRRHAKESPMWQFLNQTVIAKNP